VLQGDISMAARVWRLRNMGENHHGRRFTRPIASGVVLAVAGALTLSSSAAGSADVLARPPQTVYAITFSHHSALYLLHPRSHAVILEGRARVELTDITFRGKTLYAISFTTLYRLNPKTGASHRVGSLGLTAANALATQPKTNILYGADQLGHFFKISARTGHVTRVGVFGHGLGSMRDLTFANGHLYAAVFRPGSTRALLARVNLRTGAARIIGRMGFNNVFGLVTGQGALYGATFGGSFLAISPRTGHGRVIWKEGIAVGGLATP